MSMNDGGPAFALGQPSPWPGMSLRDYFAAAAATGFIASYSGPDIQSPTPEKTAVQAYAYADALLKERENRNESSD